MRSLRSVAFKPVLVLSIGLTSVFGVGAAQAQNEISIRGLVDCGARSEKNCDLSSKKFFFWTQDLGGGTQHLNVDISWIKEDSLPYIDQDDELCLTGFIRSEDGVYQATALNENCDEGTVNDKEAEREKKDDRKEKN